MAFDKKQYITNQFGRKVGKPILDHEIDDDEIERAISDVCLRYYQACPIKHVVRKVVQDGYTKVTISDLMEDLFDDDDELYYFLGITRADYVILGEGVNSNYAALLAGSGGINVSSGASTVTGDYYGSGALGGISLWEPTAALQQASVRDQVVADLEVLISEIEDSVRFLAPVAGSVAAEYGFGFMGNHTDTTVAAADKRYPWEGVPLNHLDVMSNLVSEELVTAILSGRSAVRIGQGPELDTTALENIRQELHEQNMNDLAGISTPVAFFG